MPKRLQLIGLTIIATCIVLMALPLLSGFTKVSAQAPDSAAIARMWHGRVPVAKADEYTTYLNQAGVQKIRAIAGNQGIQMFRRLENDVAEFYVISYWKSRNDIRKFAGNDIEKTRFLPRDQEYLIEPERYVKHFDVLIDK